MTQRLISTGFLESLNELRKEARANPLSVLVWGPGESDCDILFSERCVIKTLLTDNGHEAHFSEDLCRKQDAFPDPVEDEKAQAMKADAIIILYQSRGTQTEMDRIILPENRILKKTIVVVKSEVLRTIHDSISGYTWKNNIADNAMAMVEYEQLPLDDDIRNQVLAPLEKMRQTKYLEKGSGGYHE